MFNGIDVFSVWYNHLMPAKQSELSPVLVMVTAGSSEEAHVIADKLLSLRKAACVNIITGVSSFFWWKGCIDSSRETMLLIKTRKALLDDVIALVKSIHSYELPEIIALPIVSGSQDYLDWIANETA